jgi:hypothetical protein
MSVRLEISRTQLEYLKCSKNVRLMNQVFSQVLRFPPPIKLTPMIYIALLKVGFNTITPITLTLDIISDFTDMSPEELRTAAYEAQTKPKKILHKTVCSLTVSNKT